MKVYRLRKRPWTEAEDAVLRDCAARGWTVTKMSLRLRRPTRAVKRRARQLDLTISEITRLPASDRALV